MLTHLGYGSGWNANVVDVENQAQAIGAAPNESNAYTINGLPGDLYPCSQKQTYKLKVKQGKTYLLRIINAALNEQQFFKIANHRFTVVALDAGYTEPYDTDVVVVAPGQTIDVLFRTNQKVGSYYMVASQYHTLNGPFNNSTTRGVVVYHAFFRKVHGVYTKDFPNKPPIEFDYTNPAINQNAFLAFAPKSTKVKTLKFNSTVEIVLQNTTILVMESHPIHIHGFNFHVLAQGFGNYNSTRDEPKFNLVNPQMRNTIVVPVGGWAVIRFQANNPVTQPPSLPKPHLYISLPPSPPSTHRPIVPIAPRAAVSRLQHTVVSQTYKLKVKQGKTYLLRIINAALNEQQFFKIANHRFTVVALDAGYTEPYDTDVVVVTPGQTTDVLFRTNQKVGFYYMVASPYHTLNGPFNNSTTRGVVVYHGASSITPPKMPNLPIFNDTPIAHKFYTNITGLVNGPHWVPVPCNVEEHMFITFGVNLDHCNLPNKTCGGPNGLRFSASMNNESFVLPSGRRFSMLEAFFRKVHGVYTKDFPNKPPIEFDYTNPAINQNAFLAFAPKSKKVKTLKFNSTVEIVLQNTAILVVESHPIHIHGFNFHVLAQGFGNYNSSRDEPKFNLVNPQMRNTIAVPMGGWAVIRFQANNPGMWFVHCHFDVHVPWGLAMAFEVENGPTPSSTLPPPPVDFPKC
ncbi:Multicopper oxidase, type 1 [Sesbania bispinosa]|nr:Multicopper oxidase, type 1 [Sesbania bispinosa]